MTPANKEKKEVIEKLLKQHHSDPLCGAINITVDARKPGVVLPKCLLQESGVKLELSSLPGGNPISLDEHAIRVDLFFSSVPVECILPWEAIWQVAYWEGTLYKKQFFQVPPDKSLPPAKQPKQKAQSKKTLGGLAKGELELICNDNPELSPPKSGHLSLVK